MDNLFTPTGAQTSESESLAYIFEMLLSGHFFIEIVKVVAVRGVAPNLVVDALPLLSRTDSSGAMISNSIIYDLPVWRLQRGNSAVIMDPVVGDIGVIGVCDRDTSLVRANLKESVPGSKRKHNKSDAIYFGGILNAPPTQYVEFADNKINIVAPNGVSITTPDMYVSGNIRAGGDITDNVDTQSASLKTLRDKYDQHKHPVPGIQTGGSTVTSNTTDKPA
ncbi:TPA: phage baseplate protein [Enterobacter roggenkampii]